jgi:hypothetical protein
MGRGEVESEFLRLCDIQPISRNGTRQLAQWDPQWRYARFMPAELLFNCRCCSIRLRPRSRNRSGDGRT